jgi:hypothetical protein
MNYYLTDESIFDIVSIIRNIGTGEKRYSVLLFVIDWLRREGIAQESRQRIVKLVTGHNKFESPKQDSEMLLLAHRKNLNVLNDPVQIDNSISPQVSKEDASRISRILRSIVPSRQDFMHFNGKISFQMENMIYGILSYCGPTIVVCDYKTRQLVKGIVVSKWDKAGNEHKIIHYHDVITLACPLELVIYESPNEVQTKYEVKWETYTGSRFTIGPVTMFELIEFLKQKGLVLYPSLCETGLIALFKAFLDVGKGEVRRSFPVNNKDSS